MVKNVNINLDFGSMSKFFRNNVEVVFALILLSILVLEGFVIKSSVSLVSNATPDAGQISSNGVRVNFTNYDAVTNRIDSADGYVPPVEQIQNPFTPPPTAPAQ